MSKYIQFNKINPMYMIFSMFILVPNLILGIYGYNALKNQQEYSEDQMISIYTILINEIISYVNTDVKRIDSEFSKDNKLNSNITISELLEYYQTKNSIYKHLVFLDNKDRFHFAEKTPQSFIDDFSKIAAPELIERINEHISGYPTNFIVSGIQNYEYNSYYCFKIFNERKEFMGMTFGMYDSAKIHEQLFSKAVSSLKYLKGLELNLNTGAKQNSKKQKFMFHVDWLGAVFPYWSIDAKIDDIQKFRTESSSSTSIFLILFASMIPLIAGTILLLLFRIIREMKVAHLKTDFVSRITHELRTPLTSIKMFSEMLEMESIPDEQKSYCVEIIQRETLRLSKLVDRVLNFSKLDSRNKVFHFEPADIEKILVDTIKFFEQQIPDKDFNIKVILDYRHPQLIVDKDGIREILLNLLENSYKYSGDTKIITVRLVRVENKLIILVADKGFGIPKEDLKRVFDKFYRVDDQINRAIDGTGLGLSICREIAKAHGGNIIAESERGVGSKFIVSIPFDFKPSHWAKYSDIIKK